MQDGLPDFQSVDQVVLYFWDHGADGEGYVNLKTVAQEATEYLIGRPDLLDVRKTVHGRIRALDRMRRGTLRGFYAQQASFLDEMEQSYLTIGNAQRVRMDLAQRPHVRAYWDIKTKEYEASDAAYKDETRTIVALFDEWRPEQRTLRDVWLLQKQK